MFIINVKKTIAGLIIMFAAVSIYIPTARAEKTESKETKSQPAAQPAEPSIKMEKLAGSWAVQKGGSFEEITLNSDNTYSTFLHQRPFDSGKWKVNNNILLLKSNAGQEMSKLYTGISLTGNILNLGKSGEVWKKLK